MSSTPSSSSAGQWPPRRPSMRSKLRNGTWIVPSTGERSRRNFTLRAHQIDGPNDPAIVPVFTRQSMPQRARAAAHNVKTASQRFVKWLNSPMGRGVIKCTLAYTIASLTTYWAPLSDFLGKPDGKHVVATITVYFHPARSAGSMIEAILIAIVAVAYAEVVSILSMCTSVLFGSIWGMAGLAHALVLIVFIGGGFGFIGWAKQKLNNPLVNVGSTLASLAIIGVVTKETAVLTSVFSNQKIVQIFKMLVMGITATTAVNLLVWRVSAVDLLRQSMGKASTSLGDMLAMVTRGFLSGSENDILSSEFAAASSAYSSVYPQLAKNLRESKFERYFLGHEKIYKLDRAVVKSMETLAQSIGGLRSAANTQLGLLREAMGPPSGALSPDALVVSPLLQRSPPIMPKAGGERFFALSSIDEASDESTEDERNRPRTHRGLSDDGATASLASLRNGDVRNPLGDGAVSDAASASFRNSSDIFELFISLLGPSMKSLAHTLSEVLREPAFGSAPDYRITINDHFGQSLSDALALFNTARANALQELYMHLEFGRARSEKIQADFEEVAAACGHFSFSLQAFGEEMQKYLDVLADLKHANENRTRSWNWMMWWRKGHNKFQGTAHDAEERQTLIKPIKKTAMPKGIPDTILKRRDTYSWDAAPQASKVVATISQRLLRLIRKIARDDVRFGLKVGIGACLWTMFAFIPQTRDTYQHWRGEWGLLSFMIVCSMTVGASNTTGVARFLGTVIGLGASALNWNVAKGSPIGLMFLGWIVAFWSFWMIVARGNAPLGRITLLAYNVSTLYAYSLSQKVEDDDDDEGGVHPIIAEIVRHRFIAVTAGILWGLVVCRLIWPISARKKFQQGISTLYLQMGLIWKRGPLAILLRSDSTRSYLKTGEQAALLKYAARLDALRDSAASEFELRGPFPTTQSARLMQCTHRLLDAFHAMSLVTQRRGHLTEGERALLLFTADERAALCDRICHIFQVLASSLMLEYPLTEAIPSVEVMRDRLLGKIFQFRKEHVQHNIEGVNSNGNSSGGGGAAAAFERKLKSLGALTDVTVEERDYALLYAYALVTGQVSEELKVVAKEIEGLFGVLHVDSSLLQ
ncbi:Fusaric acid resistance protein-like-domain-containing protein [Bombardia bombarda]|uniref:Fusaric acid resistance protein-like-domain-containing protein n=1 Tax=Bombardia bombarda TaxID=252184 RepID=A0AA39WIA3_9PEZI|nr:Fusaric acid resistance protein-like-domain-containing protein [Bombardia bombarda]